MFPPSPIFDLDAIKSLEQEAATGAPAPDEALLSLVEHLVKQPEPFDIFGRLVTFTDTALQDGRLVQLSIVMPHWLDSVLLVRTGNCGGFGNPKAVLSLGNSQGIVDVVLGKLQQLGPGALGDVPLGFNHRDRERGTQPLHKRFAHDPHEGGVPGGLSAVPDQFGQ